MNIHEYQAKELFRQQGIPTPQGKLATTPDEAARLYDELQRPQVVLKAQIHSGGRGKAGGIGKVKSREEARSVAQALLGKRLVTAQTGPAGKVVHKLLIEETLQLQKEYYLGITLDRKTSLPVMMVSSMGGMDIEEVAHTHPESIGKVWLRYETLTDFQIREIISILDLPSALAGISVSPETLKAHQKKLAGIVKALVRLFYDTDSSLIEINPLGLEQKKGLLSVDAKIVLDDRGLVRHPELEALRDIEEENPLEYEASQWGLSFVQVEGNIGCLVNGAGLAMATMDIIKYAGGKPANFLDVGGGANKEQVTQAFRLLLSQSDLKAILVNIFGGIMRCDIIAESLVAAVRELKPRIPIVVRLEGTNVEQGKKILNESLLHLTTAGDMAEAAQKVVTLAQA